jgi:hypothetical protein
MSWTKWSQHIHTHSLSHSKGKARGLENTRPENNIVFDAWMKIGQDPIFRTEHKGGAYWRSAASTFMWVGNSHPKIWRVIGLTSLFKGGGHLSKRSASAYEHVKERPLSGIGVQDLVKPRLI